MREFEGSDRREANRGLHLSPEISYGHIATTVMLIVAAFATWYGLERRVVVLETRFGNHSDMQIVQEARQDSVNREILTEMKLMRRELKDFMIESAKSKGS